METIHHLNPPKFPVCFPVIPNLIGHSPTENQLQVVRSCNRQVRFLSSVSKIGEHQVYCTEEQATQSSEYHDAIWSVPWYTVDRAAMRADFRWESGMVQCGHSKNRGRHTWDFFERNRGGSVTRDVVDCASQGYGTNGVAGDDWKLCVKRAVKAPCLQSTAICIRRLGSFAFCSLPSQQPSIEHHQCHQVMLIFPDVRYSLL